MLDWSKIKKLFLKQEELTAEEINELNTEFGVSTAHPAMPSSAPSQVMGDDAKMLKALLEKNAQENEALRKLLLDEKAEKEKRAKEMEEQFKKDFDKKKQEVLEKLQKAAVLAPADEDGKRHWEALLEANFESTAKLAEKQIEALRAGASATTTEPSQTTQTTAKTLDRGELMSRATNAFKATK